MTDMRYGKRCVLLAWKPLPKRDLQRASCIVWTSSVGGRVEIMALQTHKWLQIFLTSLPVTIAKNWKSGREGCLGVSNSLPLSTLTKFTLRERKNYKRFEMHNSVWEFNTWLTSAYFGKYLWPCKYLTYLKSRQLQFATKCAKTALERHLNTIGQTFV